MRVFEAKKIIQEFFADKDFLYFDNKRLKVNNNNYHIIPDDAYKYNSTLLVIEYEGTARPVESITKYWWLFNSTNWIDNNMIVKLLIIGLSERHKGIRDESIRILGDELCCKFPNNFFFFYIPWDKVNKDVIVEILKEITNQ